MQVEVCVEVDERVERLVRCAHLLRGDAGKQQVSREVLRTVSKGTQRGWSQLVGLGHVQEEAYARSDAAEGVSTRNTTAGWVSLGEEQRHVNL